MSHALRPALTFAACAAILSLSACSSATTADSTASPESASSEATAGSPASTVPVSLASGGVILTGFGAYTPMLSSELKLGLSDMAGQIETGGMVISTPFDV